SIYKNGVPGYRVSDDLISWKSLKFPDAVLPKILDQKGECMAPAVLAKDGYVYWAGLGGRVAIRSANPDDENSWEVFTEKANTGFDPCYFLDDDGKIYNYFGGLESNVVQLKPEDLSGVGGTNRQITPKTKGAETLINSPYGLHQGKIEYETRYSDWNKPETLDTARLIRTDPPQKPQFSTVSTDSMQEAAWMTKFGGKYYLQNSNPGTACPWYSDSVYVSDFPDKDFKLADYATASLKVGGFINSTGHSCVFKDFNGNWWRITTMWVGVHAGFERRLGLFPVGFDKEGRMFTQTYLGDYPMVMPNKQVPMGTSLLKDWDNLSLAAQGFSECGGEANLKKACDENVRTWWSAGSGEAGLSYELRWDKPVKAGAIQVNFAEEKIDQSANDDDYHAYKLFYKESSGGEWKLLVDKSKNKTSVAHDYIELARPVKMVALKIENVHMAKRGNFAIRDLRVFGKMGGAKPKAISSASAVRDGKDPRNIKFTWQNPDAASTKGYILNYGVAPDALHLSVQYQNPQAQELTLSCFNAEAKDYYFRIDTYNENGITQGKVKKVVMGAK
ncbi:MAG: hypothetical protein IKO42_01590, partial [Opitutales bacterium]|nr:hypothetical protein [Opitutales bacterium]